MSAKKKLKFAYFLIMLLSLTLAGCADDDYSADEQQSGGMSSQGMGQGGGGGGPGGGGGGSRSQGPPGSDQDDSSQELPVESFTACHDKKEGDFVLLVLAEGKELQATCKLIDDQMVAVPKESKKEERRPPKQ